MKQRLVLEAGEFARSEPTLDSSAASTRATAPAGALRVASRYGVAIVASALATAATAALWPSNHHTVFAFYYVAVLVSATYAHAPAGLAAVALSALAANYFFLEPRYGFASDADSLYNCALFATIATVLTLLVERLQARERKLRASQLRLADAQRIARVGSWDWQIESGHMNWSDQLFEVLGVSRDTVPGYDAFITRVHPEDRARVAEELRVGLAEKEEITSNYRLLLPDGTVKMIHGRGAVERDEEGRALSLAGTTLDITERAKADEALRRSEERFRSLVQMTAAITWLTDAAGDVTESTPSWSEFTGLSPAAMTEAHGWFSAVHPEDRARACEMWRKAIESGSDYYNEYRLRRHDGAWRDMVTRGIPIRNADGSIREWIGTCVDVTEAKAAAKAAEFQASVLNATGESIIATDPAGKIIYMNRFAETQWGWSSAEALGRDIMDVTVPLTSRKQAGEIMEALCRGETWTGEFLAQRRSGETFPIHASNTALFGEDGKLAAIIGVGRDISERHESERALRESEERYRAAFDQAAVGVCQIAFDGTFERANPRLCQLLGYTCDELLKLKFSDITHPDDLALSVQLVTELSAQQREWFAIDKRYLRKDGSVMWASSTVSLMRNREGTLQSFVAIVEDISAQKEAELALRQREAELRALTVRLNAAREEEAKRIARELHDELGQTLTAITLQTADAQRQLAETDGATPAEVLQHHLTTVRTLTDQAISTTRRVCTELRPALLDQVGFVPALEWQAHDFESRTGIFCSLKLPDPAPEIGGDVATALFRIFQEILTNVARHADATEVTVDLTSSAEDIRLTVQDNGRGFTEVQAKKTSGLGLIGIRERTLAIGGRVSFDGGQGQGTRVSIVVPQPIVRAENG